MSRSSIALRPMPAITFTRRWDIQVKHFVEMYLEASCCSSRPHNSRLRELCFSNGRVEEAPSGWFF
ncbi:hypothetical protein E2C01_006499 [Portunus trituberculatus]|uniref:Uncharacterized protein n=1 Tax=Portunus trituberculatus TaxID=210409 RepID=A0A5B7CXI5_PORTR|nr:hypothetical protein [Portunus trituberculatus]